MTSSIEVASTVVEASSSAIPSWFEWLTLIALFTGPAIAVFVTRWVDERRAVFQRRQDIFKTLMRTRRAPTSPEHVGALNLIELEFQNEADIITRWKALYGHFAAQHQRTPSEAVDAQALPTDEVARRDQSFYARLFDERQKLLAKLLHAMGRKLGFRSEQLEIFEGGYLPQGWVDTEAEQMALRRFLVDLGAGRRWLPVGVFNGNPDPPTPPPPAPSTSAKGEPT
jgi:hypothetical protein